MSSEAFGRGTMSGGGLDTRRRQLEDAGGLDDMRRTSKWNCSRGGVLGSGHGGLGGGVGRGWMRRRHLDNCSRLGRGLEAGAGVVEPSLVERLELQPCNRAFEIRRDRD